MRHKQKKNRAKGAWTANAEDEFERELEVFRTEAKAASQFFYAFLSVHGVAGDVPAVFKLLNSAPLFWNTNLGGLQTSTFVTLGRIFEQNSTHNIDRILRIAQDNPQIFSKAALGNRKKKASPDRHEWLNDYLRDAYVPKQSDFRRLRKLVRKYRKIYEEKYREIRHKIFCAQKSSRMDRPLRYCLPRQAFESSKECWSSWMLSMIPCFNYS
jgi:hypothetical protein